MERHDTQFQMNTAKRDPSVYYGPGYWDVIHRLAFSLCEQSEPTPAQVTAAIDTCLAIMKRFPCSICRGHIDEYLAANPINKVCLSTNCSQQGNPSFFRWTWRYHNVVNYRKGKPLLTYEEAYRLYEAPLATCPGSNHLVV